MSTQNHNMHESSQFGNLNSEMLQFSGNCNFQNPYHSDSYQINNPNRYKNNWQRQNFTPQYNYHDQRENNSPNFPKGRVFHHQNQFQNSNSYGKHLQNRIQGNGKQLGEQGQSQQ
jgi:hypothetical protein